jgi:hypothetical protein
MSSSMRRGRGWCRGVDSGPESVSGASEASGVECSEVQRSAAACSEVQRSGKVRAKWQENVTPERIGVYGV